MANTTGQWHTLIDCYGRHRRPVARSNWLIWPTPQAPGTGFYSTVAIPRKTDLFPSDSVDNYSSRNNLALCRRACDVDPACVGFAFAAYKACRTWGQAIQSSCWTETGIYREGCRTAWTGNYNYNLYTKTYKNCDGDYVFGEASGSL